MRKRVLVIGWYGHGNLGDEAFRASFPLLWPDCDFDFADSIKPETINFIRKTYAAALIGGGSFLDSGIQGIEHLDIPLGFVGIGCGKHISQNMRAALERAAIVVVRDKLSLTNLPSVVSPTMVASDLVYARPSWPEWDSAKANRITVILSEHFAPRGDCSEWVGMSWQWFCRELAQVLDQAIIQGLKVEFWPMSTTRAWDDRRAAAHVISRMVKASEAFCYPQKAPVECEFLQALVESRVVISQRLHGSIFSAAVGAPVIPVSGHDKVRGFCGEIGLGHLDYYALSAAKIKDAVADALERAPEQQAKAQAYIQGARKTWLVASHAVAKALSLS